MMSKCFHKWQDMSDKRGHVWSCKVCGAVFAPKPVPPVDGYTPYSKRECTRSHPHEEMDAICELRTKVARLTSRLAYLEAEHGILGDA